MKTNNMRVAVRARKIEIVQRRPSADLYFRVAEEADLKSVSKRGQKKITVDSASATS